MTWCREASEKAFATIRSGQGAGGGRRARGAGLLLSVWEAEA